MPSKCWQQRHLEVSNAKLVCSTNVKLGTFHRCLNWLGSGQDQYLKNIHEAHEVPLEDIVQYKQWITTDRTNLQDISSSFQDFVEMLVDKVIILLQRTNHHTWLSERRTLTKMTLYFFAENLFSDPRCFTDGAASQYKNLKNYSNLVHHQEDFGLTAEWHFLPPATARMPVLAKGAK